MPTFTVAGITDEVDTCECCGRTDLKRAVALQDRDSGEVTFFGVVCAARALAIDAGDVLPLAKDAQRRVERQKQAERDRLAAAEWRRWVTFLQAHTGLATDDVATLLQAAGGFAAARAQFARVSG